MADAQMARGYGHVVLVKLLLLLNGVLAVPRFLMSRSVSPLLDKLAFGANTVHVAVTLFALLFSGGKAKHTSAKGNAGDESASENARASEVGESGCLLFPWILH